MRTDSWLIGDRLKLRQTAARWLITRDGMQWPSILRKRVLILRHIAIVQAPLACAPRSSTARLRGCRLARAASFDYISAQVRVARARTSRLPA